MEGRAPVSNNAEMQQKPLMRRTFIRDWRKAKGLTIEQLAERLDGMAPSNLSMLERGLRGYVQSTLERIAEELDTDVASLLSRRPTEDEPIVQIFAKATPVQRRQIVEIAKTITQGSDE